MKIGIVATLLVLATLAFFGFAVYFIFKMLQFVIQATNLYKKMVERQDMMIKLLSDIKDKSSSSRLIEARNEPKITTENKAPVSSSTSSAKPQDKVTAAIVDKKPTIPDDEVGSVCPHCDERYRDNLTGTDCPSCGGSIITT